MITQTLFHQVCVLTVFDFLISTQKGILIYFKDNSSKLTIENVKFNRSDCYKYNFASIVLRIFGA